MIEGQWLKANPGGSIDLSEQQIVDCSSGYGNNGCKGGNMYRSWQFLAEDGGSNSDSSYPFFSGTTKLAGECMEGDLFTKISSNIFSVEPNELAFMTALNEYGPIGVVRLLMVQNFKNIKI